MNAIASTYNNFCFIWGSTMIECGDSWWMKTLKRPFDLFDNIFKVYPFQKILKADIQDLAKYLIEGTQYAEKDCNAIIKSICRFYKLDKKDNMVRLMSLAVVKYAAEHKYELSMSFLIIKNNNLWLKLIK